MGRSAVGAIALALRSLSYLAYKKIAPKLWLAQSLLTYRKLPRVPRGYLSMANLKSPCRADRRVRCRAQSRFGRATPK